MVNLDIKVKVAILYLLDYHGWWYEQRCPKSENKKKQSIMLMVCPCIKNESRLVVCRYDRSLNLDLYNLCAFRNCAPSNRYTSRRCIYIFSVKYLQSLKSSTILQTYRIVQVIYNTMQQLYIHRLIVSIYISCIHVTHIT